MKRIYFDYAASTPVDPAVLAAMRPYFSERFGNPGAVHRFGQEASAAVFSARRRIAESLGADYSNIIFTGSATQANNLALRGVIKNWRHTLKAKSSKVLPAGRQVKARIIISAFEHPSVLETARDLKKSGVEIVIIPVNKDGFIDIKKIKAALNERTVLVSVMYVNNEVGTIQPIAEIGKAISEFRKQKVESSSKNSRFYFLDSSFYPLFHTDAVQAFQYLPCNVDELGVDLMTLSAHKIYGPKGIGALYIRSAEMLAPVITGGGQEQGLQSGTENVPYIVGFGKAVEMVEKQRIAEFKRIIELQDYCWKQLKKALPYVQLNGSLQHRTPNNLNVYLPGKPSYELMMALDLQGISVSPGEACSARAIKPSDTLLAMGLGEQRAFQSLRITFGRQTTKKEIDALVKKLKEVVED